MLERRKNTRDTIFFVITPIIFLVIPTIILIGTVHQKYCLLVNPVSKYEENEKEIRFVDVKMIKTRKIIP